MAPPDTDGAAVPAGFHQLPMDEGFVGLVGPLYVRPGPGGVFGFRVEARHANPVGICHGGMVMTVADMAVGFAALLASGRSAFPPSINNTFDFLAPARIGDWLETRVDFVHPTRRMATAHGLVHRDGEAIVRFNGICRLPRDDDPRFAGDGRFQRMMDLLQGAGG
ncbi:MAG: PaaI family thioesterase [Hyphomicrobiales bacterium]|nr:PaaI family thioesterase [Hyphomicrobiales bacterium]